MKIYNELEQGTQEWLTVRLGKFTASDAQAIANNGKGLETLVYQKAAECITNKLPEAYTNADLERGKELESTARNSYELETGNKVTEIGFVELDSRIGCSPDGFVGTDGLVEFKCKNDINYLKFLLSKEVETAHLWQVQMQMYVCDRQWCDYVVFNPNFPEPLTIVRVERNEASIAKIKVGLSQGVAELEAILEKVQNPIN